MTPPNVSPWKTKTTPMNVVKELVLEYRETGEAEDYGLQQDSPLLADILGAVFPPKFKIPTFQLYDESTDSRSHLATFRTMMHLQTNSEDLMC
ncbi:hypothetical protein JCGZ_14886 [Jatropha curcas]|uniref:Uncharacterized protein n=1 Tax=Jatropha curcas TaxID=180498 RepID=A0A067KIV4_JATCU|nr:hypothetical protein JCGZ_14886 [Jatropha curcas]